MLSKTPDRDAKPYIVVLGDRTDDPTFLDRARRFGRLIYIDRSALANETAGRWNETTLLLDYANAIGPLAEVIQAVVGANDVIIVSQTELGLLPAAQLRELLNKGQADVKAVSSLRDKRLMRTILDDFEISPVKWAAGGKNDLSKISALLNQAKDIILKPFDGAGSKCVFRVQTDEQLINAVLSSSELGVEGFIAEEYLSGDEISVETFSFSGKHTVVAIVRKTIQENFVEIGHMLPAALSGDIDYSIRDLVRRFLDAINLLDGPAHTEIKLTAQGPKIIESQSRVAGDKIALLVKEGYGVDLFDLTFLWALGKVKPILTDPLPIQGAAVRFITPPVGKLRSVRNLSQVIDSTIIDAKFRRKVGDDLPLIRSSVDRSGYVVAIGRDADEAASRADQVIQKLEIEVW